MDNINIVFYLLLLIAVALSWFALAFNKAFTNAFNDWGEENFRDWLNGGANEPVDKTLMKLCQIYDNAQKKVRCSMRGVLTFQKKKWQICFIGGKMKQVKIVYQWLVKHTFHIKNFTKNHVMTSKIC